MPRLSPSSWLLEVFNLDSYFSRSGKVHIKIPAKIVPFILATWGIQSWQLSRCGKVHIKIPAMLALLILTSVTCKKLTRLGKILGKIQTRLNLDKTPCRALSDIAMILTSTFSRVYMQCSAGCKVQTKYTDLVHSVTSKIIEGKIYCCGLITQLFSGSDWPCPVWKPSSSQNGGVTLIKAHLMVFPEGCLQTQL